jgi:hypothetical protein
VRRLACGGSRAAARVRRLACGGSLPAGEVARVVREVAGALSYAHRRGVVPAAARAPLM